jgi:hypothetical protein
MKSRFLVVPFEWNLPTGFNLMEFQLSKPFGRKMLREDG